jgi:hypothetical protein
VAHQPKPQYRPTEGPQKPAPPHLREHATKWPSSEGGLALRHILWTCTPARGCRSRV